MVQKRKCPMCGKRAGVCLVYGEVGDPTVIAQVERGEIVLGGCVVTGTDPDWHCGACSHDWRARRSGAKKPPPLVLSTEMLQGLREFGLPALRRINEADDIVGRLAPMGVFRGWAEHFGLPQAAVDPAFELACFWAANSEGARALEIPYPIRATFEGLNMYAE